MCRITATEFKQNLGYYMELSSKEDVYVMKNNKVVTVLCNPHYKAYLEALDIISKLNPDPEVNKKSFDELYDEMMEEKYGSSSRH